MILPYLNSQDKSTLGEDKLEELKTILAGDEVKAKEVIEASKSSMGQVGVGLGVCGT